MDFKSLKRNPSKILSALKELGDSLVTTKPLYIYVPAFYEERGLADLSSGISIIGFNTWVIDGEYDFTIIPAMLHITPTVTTTVKGSDGIEYFEFYFEAGAVVMPKAWVQKKDTLTYMLYTVIHSKAKVPWFFNYDTFGETFALSKEYAGIDLNKSKDKLSVLCALQSRNPENPSEFYKDTIKDMKQLTTNPPEYIPISSLVHAATGTMSRIGGRDFIDGITSTLVHPHNRVEELEGVLRQ